MDSWLARMDTVRVSAAKIGLRVVLAWWPEDNLGWEGYSPGFREAGGDLRGEIHDYEYRDRRSIFDAKLWRNGL